LDGSFDYNCYSGGDLRVNVMISDSSSEMSVLYVLSIDSIILSDNAESTNGKDDANATTNSNNKCKDYILKDKEGIEVGLIQLNISFSPFPFISLWKKCLPNPNPNPKDGNPGNDFFQFLPLIIERLSFDNDDKVDRKGLGLMSGRVIAMSVGSRQSILSLANKLLHLNLDPALSAYLDPQTPNPNPNPTVISLSKVKELSAAFFSSQISSSLSLAPILSDGLVVKLLTLFISIGLKDKDDDFTLYDLKQFCRLITVWGLFHAIQAASLITKYKISQVEVRALSVRFLEYDTELNGTIKASDLVLLLKDMGGDYSEKDLALILGEIDSKGVNIVELGVFVRWWCGPVRGQ
jgi:hypothetical protein